MSAGRGMLLLLTLLRQDRDDVNRMINEQLDASHLCGEPNCFNPDHLVVESRMVNEDRKSCQRNSFVSELVLESGDILEIGTVGSSCPHAPQCIPKFRAMEIKGVLKAGKGV